MIFSVNALEELSDDSYFFKALYMSSKKINCMGLFLTILLMLSHSVYAGNEQKGRATLAIKGTLLSKITDAERLATRRAAILDAWKNYINDPNTGNISRIKDMDNNKTEIVAKLNQCAVSPGDCEFMSRIEYVAEKIDEEKKTYTVIVIASINEMQVSAYLSKKSPAGKTASGEGSRFAFLFLQRNTTSNKQTLDKREGQAEASASVEVDSKENSASASVKKSASIESTETSVRDKAKYAVDISGGQDVATALTQDLNQSGFEVSDVEAILYDCEQDSINEEIMSFFQLQGTIGGRQFSKIANTIKKCREDQSFKFLAVAEAEASAPYRERGMQIITMSLRVTVKNIEKRDAITIAAAGPIQISGEGRDSSTATKNALAKVGAAAAKIIIDTMNQKKLN